MRHGIIKFLPSAIIFSPAAGLLINILIELSGIKTVTDYSTVYNSMISLPLVKMIILYCIVSPIAEELVFRRIIYRILRLKLNVVFSALLSSLLFGLYHGNLVQFIYAFIMGLFFAVLFELSKTIVVPIISHAANNMLAVVISYGLLDYVYDDKKALALLMMLLLAFLLYWFYILSNLKKDLGKENNG